MSHVLIRKNAGPEIVHVLVNLRCNRKGCNRIQNKSKATLDISKCESLFKYKPFVMCKQSS